MGELISTRLPIATRSRDALLLAQEFAKRVSLVWSRLLLALQSSLTSIGLLVLGAFVVHLPALSGPFLWDDTYLAETNPFIKSPLLILESFRHYLFLDSYSPHYRPVQNLTMMPDYYLWHDNPFGFHLSNIFWHATAGVALFFLLRKILASLLSPAEISPERIRLNAFFIALIWVVHPVHSAAVDYISGRADSVAFVFSSISWLLFLRADKNNQRLTNIALCALAFLFALLALCARESALMWLAVFLCYHLFFEKRLTSKGRLILVFSCSLLLFAYAGLRDLPAPRTHSPPAPGWPPALRLVLMLRALGDYARLMIFPNTLHMERTVFNPAEYQNFAHSSPDVPLEYLSVLGLFLLAVFALGIWRRERGRSLRIFGALWFLIGYLPISNLFDLNATVAEHWLYLPSVGLLIFLCGSVCALPPPSYRWVGLGACLFAATLSLRSYYRSDDWSNSEKFFTQTLAAGSNCRAAINLALIYARHGEYARSEHLLRLVLEWSPNNPGARNNLAATLRHLGRDKEAEKLLVAMSDERATDRQDYPRTWMGMANLARLRHAQKNDAAALALLDEANKEYPDTWELISYEAELLRENRGPAAALTLVEKFAQRNWWHHDAVLALGRVYAQEGRNDAAERALMQASRLDVHDVDSLDLLAAIRMRENRFAEAYEAQRRAVTRQPEAPRQYLMLASILEKMGRPAEAQELSATVARLTANARSTVALTTLPQPSN